MSTADKVVLTFGFLLGILPCGVLVLILVFNLDKR